MFKPNGVMVYRWEKRGRTGQIKMGESIELRARITAKRVIQNHGTAFDRETGNRVSAFWPGQGHVRLARYRFDNESSWTELPP